jgi:hypothetical protein
LGVGEYPHILGLKHYQHTKEDVEKGIFPLIKNTIQYRTSIHERLLACFIIGFLIFIYCTMFLGIGAALKNKQFLQLILFFTIIIYFAVATGPAGFDVRYRMPIMPFIIVLSCYGMIKKPDLVN